MSIATSGVPFNFKARHVVVTGAGQGIGRAIAAAFAAAGARLSICDLDDDALGATAAQCGPTAEARRLDVSRREDVQAWFAQAGPVDILVNCAGGVCGQTGQPLETVSESDWQRIFAVNSDGVFWCSQAVAPGMKAAGDGRIINISSGAGLGISLTGIQAYAASKAAQIGLTRQLAHELGPFGITVNSVAPGFVRSNPSSERQWQAFGEARQQEILSQIAMRRLGTPDDIAHAVLFLASDLAAWVTGQTLAVDGGK